MKSWFTSDTHYFHKNVITYCARPFVRPDGQPAIEQMHRTLIQNWNEVVGPRDTVFHLGDFAFGSVTQIADVRKKLEGRIVLIRGNHDRSTQSMLQAGFDEVHDRLEIELDGYKLYLAHIPLFKNEQPATEGKQRRYKPEYTHEPPKYYDYWICGHVHEKWQRRGKIINAGVDQWDFRPVDMATLVTDSKDGT